MSVASNQLGEIHQQLKDLFGSHPSITVVPIAGDPPNQYQITYNIKGLNRTEDGEISICTGHLVELTIPFGFPHFPPSCKPKSDIYHPDFDPAAICLGDVWEQDRSIVNLIVHIGKLINGDIYSTSNAFNEDAAQWYEAHADQFPLDDPVLSPGHHVASANQQAPGSDIDTLDDSDLSSDFDFLSLDQSSIEESEKIDADDLSDTEEIDFTKIQLLERQLKFFEIRSLLSEIEEPAEEVKESIDTAEQMISSAKALYKKAKEAERSGDAANALALYEQVLETVSDYPGIANTLQKLQKKTSPPGQPEEKSLEDELLAELGSKEEQKKSKKVSKRVKKKKATVSPSPADPFADDRPKPSKLPLIITGSLLLLAAAGGGYFYSTETSYLATADENYRKCKKEIDSYLFEEANDSCLAGLASLNNVKILGKSEKRELTKNLKDILDSENLKQGLAGNILLDGQYLPRKEATLVRQFRKIQTEAEALFHQQEWQKAAQRLKDANKIAEQTTHISPSAREAVNVRLAVVLFRQPFDIGKRLLKDGKYKEAMAHLETAKQRLEKIPALSRETFDNELRASMSHAQLEQLQKEAKDLFTASNWQEAYRAYDKTLAIAQDTPQMSHRSMMELQTNMARAELYQTIEEGNAFFAAGDWNKAIEQYSKASEYLDKNLSILNLPEAGSSRRKLDRVTLQATIIRDKQIAAKKLEDQKFDEARQEFNLLVDHIKKSGFTAEPEFSKQINELTETLSTLDQKIYMLKKEEYLRTNFQKLFAQMYPTVDADNLSNPAISFLREEGEKLIFRMQCTEFGRGRPLTLVMLYSYNKSSGTWALHIDE